MGKTIQWAIYLVVYAAVFIAGYAWAIIAPDTGGAAVWGALGLALIAAAWLGVRRWRQNSQEYKKHTKIYLIGYSGHDLEEIAQAVESQGGALLDIRWAARSRIKGFAKSHLEKRLGDLYIHVREFGNLNYSTGGEIKIADPETGLEKIKQLERERGGPFFLMCVCADGSTCHRRIVGDMLREQGYKVDEYKWY